MLGVGAVSLSHTLPCAHMPLPQGFLALVVLNQIKIFIPRKKKKMISLVDHSVTF